MTGWKTWVGAGLAVIVGALQTLEGFGIIPAGIGNTVSIVVGAIAAAFGLVGIGHKIDRIVPG
jgi:hypothetical protein